MQICSKLEIILTFSRKCLFYRIFTLPNFTLHEIVEPYFFRVSFLSPPPRDSLSECPECTLKVLNKTNMGSIPSLRAEILLRHHVGRERPLDQIGIQWGPSPPWLVCHKLTITSLATPRLTITSYRVDWGSSI